MGLTKLSQGERIVLFAGVLLIIDLLFVAWYSVDISVLPLDVRRLAAGVDTTLTGVQSPYAGYGVAAVILTGVMIAQIVLARLLSVRLPAPGLPWSQIHLVAGIFVAVVLVIKLVRDLEALAFGSYSGVLAGILVGYGGYCIAREDAAPA
jgi:predicted secreted protein